MLTASLKAISQRQSLPAGAGKKIPLLIIDINPSEIRRFGLALNAFGNDGDSQALAYEGDTAGNGFAHAVAVAVAVDIANQFHIQLDDVWLELREHIQRRLTRAEIIDGRQKTLGPIFIEDRFQMRTISNGLCLGYLKNQSVVRKIKFARCF